tara:strand:- start:29 stop:163 length:135 start_codon:yes stop_codon:yes gene_type:complete
MSLEEDVQEIKQILTEIRDSLRIFQEFVLEVTPEQAKKEIKETE